MDKYALLIGINYRGTPSELKGCENDIDAVKAHLIKDRGYLEENIKILTEKTEDKPTEKTIRMELGNLIFKSIYKNATELWLHYSGHGSFTRDLDGDERDRRDECIVPLDYKDSGMITDDSLSTYAGSIPETCRMFCIFDCCHSGTILDLKWRFEGDKIIRENSKADVKGKVVLLSGCMDSQTAADAKIKGKWRGALTTAYLDIIKSKPDIGYKQLLEEVRKYLKKNGYSQFPRLCSSSMID